MSLTREPGRWKRAGNRERKMVSELRGRSARALSLRRVRPLKRPAVRRVSRAQLPLPQLQGRTCEGAVNQGGTTEVSSSRPCRASARKDGSFFAWHCQGASGARARNCAVPCNTKTFYRIEREYCYDYSSRFSESYRCGRCCRCPDRLWWFFFHLHRFLCCFQHCRFF